MSINLSIKLLINIVNYEINIFFNNNMTILPILNDINKYN